MKKTSKAKKFSDGGLYEAMSRMSAAKTPRAFRDDMSEIAEFTARKPGRMAEVDDVRPPRLPGRMAEVDDVRPPRLPGRVAEVFDDLPPRKPGRMAEITVGPESMPQLPTQVGDEVGGILPGGREIMYKKGGKVSSASSRGDGIAKSGKTRGKMV